jgi:hypothetical protein
MKKIGMVGAYIAETERLLNGIHKAQDEGDDRIAPGEDQSKWRPKL